MIEGGDIVGRSFHRRLFPQGSGLLHRSEKFGVEGVAGRRGRRLPVEGVVVDRKGGKRLGELEHPPLLRMVRGEGQKLASREDVLHETGQRPFRADLDEDPCPGFIHRLDAADELHGGDDLLGEAFHDLGGRIGTARIGTCRDVGDHRDPGGGERDLAEKIPNRRRGRCHETGVEGIGDGKGHGRNPERHEPFHRCIDRGTLSGDHRLTVGVLVRDRQIPGNLGEDGGDLLLRSADARHLPRVPHPLDRAHGASPNGHGTERVGEAHHTGGHTGGIFAKAMPRHDVGVDAMLGQKTQDRHVGGEHRGLRDLGLPERLFGGLAFLLSHRGVGEEEVGEPSVEDGMEDLVRLCKGLPHDAVFFGQIPAHADVLGTLTGEEEGGLTFDLRCADEDPLSGKDRSFFRCSPQGLTSCVDLSSQVGKGRGRESDAQGVCLRAVPEEMRRLDEAKGTVAGVLRHDLGCIGHLLESACQGIVEAMGRRGTDDDGLSFERGLGGRVSRKIIPFGEGETGDPLRFGGDGDLLRRGGSRGEEGGQIEARSRTGGLVRPIDIEASRGEEGKDLVELVDVPPPGMIRAGRRVGPPPQEVVHEGGERLLRAHLDEVAHTVGIHPLDLRDELHRGMEVTHQEFDDLLPGVGAGGVVVRRGVAEDRQLRGADVEPLEHLAIGRTGRCHDRGVEGMGDGDETGIDPLGAEAFDRLRHRSALPRDHGLEVAVLVRDDDIAGDFLEDLLRLLRGTPNRGHLPGIFDLLEDRFHLPAAHGDRVERILEAHDLRHDGRGVFAEAMAHHDVGRDPEGSEETAERNVGREDHGLHHLGSGELCLVMKYPLRIGEVIDEEEIEDPFPDEIVEDLVGLHEGIVDDPVLPVEVAAHVDVLRPLSRKHEGDLPRGAFPFREEDPLDAEHMPFPRLRDRFEGEFHLFSKILRIDRGEGDPEGLIPGIRPEGVCEFDHPDAGRRLPSEEGASFEGLLEEGELSADLVGILSAEEEGLPFEGEVRVEVGLE